MSDKPRIEAVPTIHDIYAPALAPIQVRSMLGPEGIWLPLGHSAVVKPLRRADLCSTSGALSEVLLDPAKAGSTHSELRLHYARLDR